MKAIWNLVSSFIVIALTIWFVQWYVKGHFGKYFIFFWLNTILAIGIYIHRTSNEIPYDHRTGVEVWEQQGIDNETCSVNYLHRIFCATSCECGSGRNRLVAYSNRADDFNK